ncbi:MAG TPA: ParB/Srx family N-terminal domain-containing protein [Sphingomonas sp.]|nr:ParB/Srx family N-terminal domain-containing protein [Sphingomonas sp.]
MSSTTLTIDQIDISPLNVRTYRPDIEDTTALEDSILERGLIQPIAVHPMKGSKRWGAIAGGRRTRAIKALVARGALPRDWAVPVTQHVGLSDAELIEVSINENLIRRDL